MALVVGGPRENLGRQVSCVRLLSSSDLIPEQGRAEIFVHPDPADPEPIWLVSEPLLFAIATGTWGRCALVPVCPDVWLMPIRPEPEDQHIPAAREASA
jgi:hypothetical protein